MLLAGESNVDRGALEIVSSHRVMAELILRVTAMSALIPIGGGYQVR